MTAAERMRAYRQRRRAAGYRVRWHPVDTENTVGNKDHQILDARSLAMHCRIAQKIDREPALLDIPRRNLERWSKQAPGEASGYLREWREILEKPWPEVAAFITSFSDDAVRLRQSSPFAGVLSPEERRELYDAFRA